jgi:hypothetical protein
MEHTNLTTIRQRYECVVERIARAALCSHRQAEDVKLVVVTKQHPEGRIREVIAAGARDLGENYADQALPKIDALHNIASLNWHMIGHVQSRKAGIVAQEFDYLHSLDSLKLAEKLDRLCAQHARRLPVLLEMNVSGEDTKTGFAAWQETAWQVLIPDIEKILALPNLEVRGLMTMAPFFDQPEMARPYFGKLVKIQAALRRIFPGNNWNELSMGMSGDFEVAIQEGATMVRIGTSIMGPRQISGTA